MSAAANAYLEEYLFGLNQRFARVPANPRNYHRATPSSTELDAVLRLQTKRSISNDWVVRYHGRYLQVLPARRRYAPRKQAVLVYESEAGQLQVHYRGELIAHQEIPAPPRQEKPARSPIHVPYSRPRYRHGPQHPYKRRTADQIKRQRLLLAAHYACHDLHPPQLLLAHRCPRHRSLLNRPQSRGHF